MEPLIRRVLHDAVFPFPARSTGRIMNMIQLRCSAVVVLCVGLVTGCGESAGAAKVTFAAPALSPQPVTSPTHKTTTAEQRNWIMFIIRPVERAGKGKTASWSTRRIKGSMTRYDQNFRRTDLEFADGVSVAAVS